MLRLLYVNPLEYNLIIPPMVELLEQVLHETKELPDTIAYLDDLKNMRKVRHLRSLHDIHCDSQRHLSAGRTAGANGLF